MDHPDPMMCGAKTRKGTPCDRTAGWGTTHKGIGRCKNHGGSSPGAEFAGGVEMARRQMVAWAQPLPISPHDVLIQAIQIAAGMVRYATDQIALLDEHDIVGPVITSVSERTDAMEIDLSGDGPAIAPADATLTKITSGPPALHIWFKARDEALDRAVHYSKVAIAAGIAERQVRVAEQQGEMFATAIRRILTELGVADHPQAPKVVRRELTVLAGGVPAAA